MEAIINAASASLISRINDGTVYYFGEKAFVALFTGTHNVTIFIFH